MLNKFSRNINDIKNIVNKSKPNKKIKTKTINKYVQIDEDNKISIAIDANVSIDEDNKETILYPRHINKIIEVTVNSILANTNEEMIFPKNIVISSNENLIDSIEKLESIEGYDDVDLSIVDLVSPQYDFKNIILNDEIKKGVNRILSIGRNRDKIVNEWNIKNSLSGKNSIVCNFYGESGSGKKTIIHSIANELNKKILIINFNQLKAIPIYNIPKTIKAIFKIATYKNAVVIIDDSKELINKKNENNCSDLINVIKSSIKVEIGNFDSMLFFTSDNKGEIDEFFRRLFFINLEFNKPNEEEREKLWSLYVSDKIKLSPIFEYKRLSQKYVGISGADIRDMLFIASSIAIEENRNVLNEMDFDIAYNQILDKYE